MIKNWLMRRNLRNVAAPAQRFTLGSGEQPATSTGPTATQLRQVLDARHARSHFFGAHLFVDPAWDILILAYVAWLEKERLFVSSLCRANVVPATTTLRWLKVLEQDGLVIHHNGPLDEAQSWLELSRQGRSCMERYLALIWPAMAIW